MELTDKDLINEYFEGNENAFETIVLRYEQIAYTFAYRILKSEADATDVLQESFVKVWKNLKKFDTSRSFKSWLLSIVYNTSIDYIRHRKHSIPFSKIGDDESQDFGDSVIDEAPIADELFSQMESVDEVERLLSTLSPDKKVIVTLHHIEGLTFEEISEIVKKPMNTVKSVYRRSIASMKEFKNK